MIKKEQGNTMDSFLYVKRDECGNYLIGAEYAGKRIYDTRFMFYTKREAIQKFRRDNNLIGKHLIKIEW